MTPMYVVAGQSNALATAGRKDVEYVLETEGVVAPLVIKSAVSGTSIAPTYEKVDWYPFDDGDPQTGELYRALLDEIAQAQSEHPDGFIHSVLWIQGERDSRLGHGADYYSNLEGLVLGLRDEFGSSFNFTIVQLADQMPTGETYIDWQVVQDAQSRLAADYDIVTLIDPDDSVAEAEVDFSDALQDGLHYNELGTDILAQAYVAQFERENLITNGSFEINEVTRGSHFQFFGALTGWETNSAFELQENGIGTGTTTSDGDQWLELDAHNTEIDEVFQTIDTVEGRVYDLALDLAARENTSTNGVQIRWNGDLVANIMPKDLAFKTYSFKVTGTGSDTLVIRETAVQNDGRGSLVDDVRLYTASQNLVVNGSFEVSEVTSTKHWGLFDSIDGWKVSGGSSFELQETGLSTGNTASEGDQWLEIDVHRRGGLDGIFQEIETSANRHYELSLDVAARNGSNTNGVAIYWNDDHIASIEAESAVWETHSFMVLGTGGSDRLEFRELENESDGRGGLIDNVSLEEWFSPTDDLIFV